MRPDEESEEEEPGLRGAVAGMRIRLEVCSSAGDLDARREEAKLEVACLDVGIHQEHRS